MVISAFKAGTSKIGGTEPTPTHLVRPIRKYFNTVPGVFTPVLAKHTKHLSRVDILAVGVDRMQRNFEPMRKQVEAWRRTRRATAGPRISPGESFPVNGRPQDG